MIPRIEISPVGPSNVVEIMGGLASKQLLPYAAIAVIDGDKETAGNCIVLPGTTAPERMVFGELKQKNWEGLPDRFGIGAGNLLNVLDDAILLPNHHNWTGFVGDKIVRSKASVWEILANQWAKVCLDLGEAQRITLAVQDAVTGATKNK